MERRLQYIPETTLHSKGPVDALTFSPNGELLASGTGRLLQVWNLKDAENNEAYIEFYAHDEALLTSLLWSQKGLICTYSTGEVAILSIVDSAGHKVCHCHGFQASQYIVRSAAINSRGDLLALAGGEGIGIYQCDGNQEPLWERIGLLPQPQGVPMNTTAEATSISWFSKGRSALLVSYAYYGIVIWDITSNEPLLSPIPGSISQGLLSADGRYFASSNSLSGSIELFDLDKNMYVHSFAGQVTEDGAAQAGRPVSFAHEDRCLVGGGLGEIKMWRLDTKECIVVLRLDESCSSQSVQLLATHTDHASSLFRIASSQRDKAISIWAANRQGIFSGQDHPKIAAIEDLNDHLTTYRLFWFALFMLAGTFVFFTRIL